MSHVIAMNFENMECELRAFDGYTELAGGKLRRRGILRKHDRHDRGEEIAVMIAHVSSP